jgi:hypothetical protein
VGELQLCPGGIRPVLGEQLAPRVSTGAAPAEAANTALGAAIVNIRVKQESLTFGAARRPNRRGRDMPGVPGC